MLRRWRLARQRALALRLPAADPSEELRSISNLVKPLERKHDSLRLLRIQPAVTQATTTGVELVLECTGAELRTLAADEHVKINKRAVVDDVQVAAFNGRVKGKGKTDKKNQVCPFLAKPGGCTFGDNANPDARPKEGAKQNETRLSQASERVSPW